MPAPRPRWGMAAFMLFVACMVAAFVWSMQSDRRALATGGERAEALVLRLESSGGRRAASYPVFGFTTARGEAVEARASVPASPAQLPPGARVTVIHEAANPHHVRDAAGFDAEPGVTPWILGAFALLLAAGAVIFVVRPPPG